MFVTEFGKLEEHTFFILDPFLENDFDWNLFGCIVFMQHNCPILVLLPFLKIFYYWADSISPLLMSLQDPSCLPSFLCNLNADMMNLLLVQQLSQMT